MVNEPVHVTDAAFEKTVLQSSLPVIVDFWAPWCGPCKMVAPILDKIAKEYAGKLVVAKVNTDENAEYAMKYGVQGIPTMLLVYEGKIVNRQVGALPEPMLRDLVDQFLEVVQDHATEN
ncbi:MAG: thioredoxin [Anaerolineaceae bacterium]|jgi:thioredoxin 1|nr:thioredoxin [Anaerolineaceae bacterium]